MKNEIDVLPRFALLYLNPVNDGKPTFFIVVGYVTDVEFYNIDDPAAGIYPKTEQGIVTQRMPPKMPGDGIPIRLTPDWLSCFVDLWFSRVDLFRDVHTITPLPAR